MTVLAVLFFGPLLPSLGTGTLLIKNMPHVKIDCRILCATVLIRLGVSDFVSRTFLIV